MPLDYRKTLIDALQSLVRNDTGAGSLAVLANTHVQDTRNARGSRAAAIAFAEGSYPKLDIAATRTADGAKPVVMAMNATSFQPGVTCDYTVPITLMVTITLTYKRLDTDVQFPLEARLEYLIRKAHKFGFAWCNPPAFSQWTRQRTTERANESTPAIPVDKSQLTLSFNLRPWMSQLVA